MEALGMATSQVSEDAMFEAPFDWNSFWDLTSPEEAAATFREIYGAAAAEAAAQCAIAAKSDDRATDHQFWIAVSAVLGGCAKTPTEPTAIQH
jgi:hypothetical protein